MTPRLSHANDNLLSNSFQDTRLAIETDQKWTDDLGRLAPQSQSELCAIQGPPLSHYVPKKVAGHINKVCSNPKSLCVQSRGKRIVWSGRFNSFDGGFIEYRMSR